MDLKDVHSFIGELSLWKSEHSNRHKPNICTDKHNVSVTNYSLAVVKLQNGGPRYKDKKGSPIHHTKLIYHASINI
jgi:hypothetical protein